MKILFIMFLLLWQMAYPHYKTTYFSLRDILLNVLLEKKYHEHIELISNEQWTFHSSS